MKPDEDLRLATRADAAELARLLSPLGYALSPADVRAVWSDWEADGNLALVVQGPDSLLGAITLHRMFVLHRPHPVGRITSLVVDPSARGAGWGRTLMRAGENLLRERGCGLIEVTSHERRRDAHDFYEHLSYERTSYRFAKTLTA